MALIASPATAKTMDTAWEMGRGAIMGAEIPSAKHPTPRCALVARGTPRVVSATVTTPGSSVTMFTRRSWQLGASGGSHGALRDSVTQGKHLAQDRTFVLAGGWAKKFGGGLGDGSWCF